MTALTGRRKRVLGYWLGGLILPFLVLAFLFHWLSRDREESGAWERAYRVASILPENVVFLHHVPDVRGARADWSDADSWRVWQAPAVAAFLEEPLSGVEEASLIHDAWARGLDLAPTEAFLASSLDAQERPQLLAGVYREHLPSSTDPAWEAIREWLTAHLGEAEPLETREHGEFTERFDDGKRTLILARHGHWCFLGNRREPIDDLLKRLHGANEGTGGRLADSPLFARALRGLPGDYASATFIRRDRGHHGPPTPEEEIAGATEPGWWRHFCAASEALGEAGISAMGLTSSVRDRKMVGFGTLLTEGSTEQSATPERTGKTLQLTSPDTLMYFATSLRPAKACARLLGASRSAPAGPDHPIFQESWFHPEWSLQLEPATRGRTALVASFTLSRPDALERFLEARATDPSGGIQKESLNLYTLRADHLPAPWHDLVGRLYVLRHAQLLVISNDRAILPELRRRWMTKGKTLESRTDFQRLQRQLPEGDVALGFVDSRRLLASAYEAVRHPLVIGALWMSVRSQTNLAVDFDKLPRTEAVAAELTPTMVVVQRTASGYAEASVGSLSPGQWLLGGGLVTAFVDHTLLQPLPKAVRDPFVTPLETMELKAQLESGK